MSRISAVLIVSLIAAILSPLAAASPVTVQPSESITSFVLRDDLPTATELAIDIVFTNGSLATIY
ncbi:hypothetical protein V8D89_006296 [Ganoderma adspersum]